MSELTIRITGTVGDGVISAGDIFTLSAARTGRFVTTYRSFPAEIRGGGNSIFQFRMSSKRVLTAADKCDILMSFDEQSLSENISYLKNGGILVYDIDTIETVPSGNFITYGVPLKTIAEKEASLRARNIVGLGFLAGLVPQLKMQEQLKDDIHKKFLKKGENVISINKKALDAGYDYALHIERKDTLSMLEIVSTGKKLIMSGNEAIALGSLVAGCRFYSGYPITPATEIMEWLAKELPKFNGNVLQCEDEIAAVTAAIGASYSGVKAMTATSGPGLSLMAEAIGLASMAEIPLVIVDVQRGGPSTGLATKPEQSDLNIAIYGTHGDTPKIVIAPINVEDCFRQTLNAFNFAEKYQVPVILLSDAALGQKRECIDEIKLEEIQVYNRAKYDASKDDKQFSRYVINESGVSPMSVPGDKGGAYTATGLEHTEDAGPSHSAEMHTKMTEKRFRKLETAVHEFKAAKKYGVEGAKIGIISWGSTSGAVIEAIEMAKEAGYMVEALYPRTIYPIPDEWINDFLKDKELLLIVEGNYSAQFANTLVYKCTCMNREIKIYQYRKYDGEPFKSNKIFEKIQEIVQEQVHKYTLKETELSQGLKEFSL